MLKQFTLVQSVPVLPPTFTAQSQFSLTRTPNTLTDGSLTLVTTHPMMSYELDLPALFLGFSNGLQKRKMAQETPSGLKTQITRLGRTPDGRGLAVMRTNGSETWTVLGKQTTRLTPSGHRSDEADLVVFDNGTLQLWVNDGYLVTQPVGGVYVTHTTSGQLSLRGNWLEPVTLFVPPLSTAFSLRRGDELWSLIGVAEDLSIVHVHVNLKPSPSLTLHSHSSLPLPKPMMILPVDPMAWSGTMNGIDETAEHDVILSVSTEGELSFWVTENRSKAADGWICTGKVTTQRIGIRMARCSSAKKTVLGELTTRT